MFFVKKQKNPQIFYAKYQKNPRILSFYVQNSCSPVGVIFPPHLGQVYKSHFLILSDPHLRQSLPTMELKLGAASPMTPPTTPTLLASIYFLL